MTLRKRFKHWLSYRASFHFYAGEGLTEAKLRIGSTHYRISRWKYPGKRAEWSTRSFRVAISDKLVSDESWLSILSRVSRDEAERGTA